MDACTHDYFTGIQGSFNETWAGIKNIIKLKSSLNSDLCLEIKLLYIRPLLKINPKIIEFLHSKLNTNDFILSLNSVLISSAVKEHTEELVPKMRELKLSLEKTMENSLRNNHRQIFLVLPHCLISKRYNSIFKEQFGQGNGYKNFYYDPFCKEGIKMPGVLNNSARNFRPRCAPCEDKEKCAYAIC